MPVKCPYGEKKGFAVFCKLLGKKVSPLKYPCTADHYDHCPIYQERAKKEEAKKEEVKEVPKELHEAHREVRARAGTRAFKKPEEATTCHECIFYSELTGMCLKLKVKVEDPTRPPCKS